MSKNETTRRLFDPLTALCPLDGRYSQVADELSDIFSEYALIKHRVYVEVSWLKFWLGDYALPELACAQIEEFGGVNQVGAFLDNIHEQFSYDDAKLVKDIERTTNHDVKACELFVAKKLENAGLGTLRSFVHICCTSEDITNLAYGLMLIQGKELICKKVHRVLFALRELAAEEAHTAMLSHTHGQPATPTTFGKEMSIFYFRLKLQRENFKDVKVYGKFNGASGNYVAALSAFPHKQWGSISNDFICSLHPDLHPLFYTTQIEPHDYIARLLNELKLMMQIIRDLDQDMWSYISREYLTQKVVATEVGSSTMPHKVNPITFENSESNIKLLTGLCNAIADELPRSRMQRDLSDSSLLRNLGMVFGYAVQVLDQTYKGLKRIEVNHTVVMRDLCRHPEVYAEAIQTVLRARGVTDAYDRLKEFTRGKDVSREMLIHFIGEQPELSDDDYNHLFDLIKYPSEYIGLSEKLANAAIDYIDIGEGASRL
ncbi:MAG: adenylosuccinate lyase [Candidatus Saccharibacteria bacterium]|nr:adenylosuccinate lyase [Candidatus Saccharibacteria bacterium]